MNLQRSITGIVSFSLFLSFEYTSLWAIDAAMPNPPGSPTVVKIGVFVADIIDLNESEESFQAELIIVAEWDDPRLAFDAEEHGSNIKLFQGSFQFNEVFAGWWPSLLILNEIGSGDVNALTIEVMSDGKVRYKEQRNVTLETPMKLQRFPFDTQVLEADIVAFGDMSDEVVFDIDERVMGATEEYAEVNQGVNIAQWRLKNLELVPYKSDLRLYGEPTEISGVKLKIKLDRKSANIIWKIIFPMVILVSLMWAVFWMDMHDLSDRLNISFIGILTIIAYQFLIDNDMPKISYFTFTDSILLFSFLVMSLTIYESLIVVSLSNRGRVDTARRFDTVAKSLFPAVYFAGLGLIASYFLFFAT